MGRTAVYPTQFLAGATAFYYIAKERLHYICVSADKQKVKRGSLGNRKVISLDVRVRVLTESGYRCAVPTCRTILALDLHHLVPVAEGGRDTCDNLLALCPTCHALFHRKIIKAESIRVWKALLVAMSSAFDKSAIDDLRLIDSLTTRLVRDPSDPPPAARLLYMTPFDSALYVSGDALIQRSGLLATGLVIADRMGNANNLSCYMLGITKKGREFVRAYDAGDLPAMRRILGHLVADESSLGDVASQGNDEALDSANSPG